MITVILCDDNEILLTRYQTKLSNLAKAYQEEVRFLIFTSGESLLFQLSEHPNEADIIFLDILMNRLNGIETAKKLRSMGCISEIIFLTSSEEFVFDSFDVSPLHYILKGSPTEDQKLDEIFAVAIALTKEKETDVFLLESSGQKKKIPLHKISYFEIRGRIMTIHFGTESLDFYAGMDAVAESLQKKRFVRCHKSYLVNLKYIDTIQKNGIVLVNGVEIPLGSSYARDVKLAFSKNLSALF